MRFALLLLIFSFSSFASANFSDSNLVLMNGPEELCGAEVMKVKGTGADKVLMIGPRISLSLDKLDEVTTDTETGCREEYKKTITDSKVIQVTKISHCHKNYKKLEGETTEEVSVSQEQVKYLHRQGSVTSTCQYKRKLK